MGSNEGSRDVKSCWDDTDDCHYFVPNGTMAVYNSEYLPAVPGFLDTAFVKQLWPVPNKKRPQYNCSPFYSFNSAF
jgi:hypothetical protein